MGFWSSAKTVTFTVMTGSLRAISSAGSALFSVLTFFRYIGKENHSAVVPLSAVAIACNLTTTGTVVIPALYRQFRNNSLTDSQSDMLENIYMNDDFDEDLENNTPTFHHSNCQCCGYYHHDLSKKGNVLYFSSKSLGILSALFASWNFYLGSITLSEFIRNKIAQKDTPLEEWEQNSIQTFAILCTIANFLYFLSYRLKKIELNATRLAKSIDSGTLSFDKHSLKTAGVSFFNLISAPFTGYFSTNHALRKIPYVTIPNKSIMAISLISSSTSLTTTLNSEVPSVYDFFKNHKQNFYYPNQSRLEPFARGFVYLTGGIDAIMSVGFSTFVSIVTTANELFGMNPYNYYLIGISLLCASSRTVMGFSFVIRQGYLDTLDDYYKNRGQVGFQSIEMDINLDSPTTNKYLETKMTIYKSPSSPLMFSPSLEIRSKQHSTKGLTSTKPIAFRESTSP